MLTGSKMFKVSDNIDSDDDFLEKEFTDDFLRGTPTENSLAARLGGGSTDVSGQLNHADRFKGSLKKSCSGNDVTPSRKHCGSNGIESTTPVTRGFQPKTKTSPVLFNSTNTSSRSEPPPPGMLHFPPGGSRINSSSNQCRRGLSPKPLEVSTSHGLRPQSIASDDVENRNSAFLAEWNDSIFNAPPEKQPDPSPAVPIRTPEVVTRKVNRAVRQRRFPGPAGLLPPRLGNTSLIAPQEFLDELQTEENDPTYQETEILSQSSGSVFEGGAWSAMLEDLGAAAHSLLKSMNLASIKAIGRNVRSYKVPFLGVLVQTIDASLPDAAVVFKDPTGEMHGVIHRDVWDQFGSDIAVGTVLVLRNVGIISAGVSSRKHVVNITGNNLTAIYSPKDELNIQLRRIHEFAASTSSKLLAEWEKVESMTTASPVTGRVQRQPQNPLFNSFQGGNYSGRLAGTPDSRAPFHPRQQHPAGTSSTRPMGPVSNQKKPIAPSENYASGSKAPANQRNVPVPSGSCNRNAVGPNRNGPLARPVAPNALNPTASSASSPFSPMPCRTNCWPTNQNRQRSQTSNENSSTIGNQKFSPKSPFALKAPANARPPQPSPNFSQSAPGVPHRPPLTPKAPQSCVPSTVPIKKPKLCPNPVLDSTNKKNPFQVETDTSAIDSLLDGIDTDSLFGDF